MMPSTTVSDDSAALPQVEEHSSQATRAQFYISLMGEMRVWFEEDGVQHVIPFKSARRRALLAYVATLAPARSRRIASSRILTDVFEQPGPATNQLYDLLRKQIALLHEEINEPAREAGYADMPIFECEKAGVTQWWLSQDWCRVDLPGLEHLHERLESVKEQGVIGNRGLDAVSTELIQLYQSYSGDYLERHLASPQFREAHWLRRPFTEYREMYLEALWDAATLAHDACMQMTFTRQQRYSYAQRAAKLYSSYALHAAKHHDLDLKRHKNLRQSERAIRGYLRMCRWFMDAPAAERIYAAYAKSMAREIPGWQPAPTTVEILRAVREHSGEHMVPPEA